MNGYDTLGRVITESHNDVLKFRYFYNAEGALTKKLDIRTGKAVNYEYDSLGRLIHSWQLDENGAIVQKTEHIFDTENRTSSQKWQFGNQTYTESYNYDTDDGALTTMTTAAGNTLSFSYLQSRYYDPLVKRFINADEPEMLAADASFQSLNLFAYCGNNPVMGIDEDGNLSNGWKIAITVGILVASAAVIVATGGVASGPVMCMAISASQGAITGAVSGAVSGAAVGAVKGAIEHRVTTGSWRGAGKAAAAGASQGAIDGAFSGAITGAISGAMNPTACFVAGTSVAVASGFVAIETLKEGDLVWAWDEQTGDVALKPIKQVFVNESSELIHLKVNGEEIITTPTHPFYVAKKGWFAAVSLRAGDILVLVNGEYAVVEQVQHELLEAPIKVYNFEVGDYHTYYVSDSGVLVHNSCRSEAVRKAWKNEQALVRETGAGTRPWTEAQMKELLDTGKVKGFVGHHMKSVKGYPSLAGNPQNIQFLTPANHLRAHQGNWRIITHGRFIE